MVAPVACPQDESCNRATIEDATGSYVEVLRTFNLATLGDVQTLVVKPVTALRYPQQCLQGTYCPIGTTSPRAVPCPPGFFCPSPNVVMTAQSTTEDEGLIPYIGSYYPEMFDCVTFPCVDGFCSAGANVNQTCTTDNDCWHQPRDVPERCARIRGTVTPVPADRGHSAPGESNVLHSKCFPGRFADVRGLPECKACPVGRKCPEFQMSSTLPCRKGYICATELTSVESVPCTAGFYCEEATSSAVPGDDSGPKPCSNRTYCLAGVGNPTAEAGTEGNSLYPQACTEGYYCEAASKTPQGTGQCKAGYFCRKSSAAPTPAQLGHFVSLDGRSSQTPCPRGTLANVTGLAVCDPCPPGHECPFIGMGGEERPNAIPCRPGTYMGVEDQAREIFCLACPAGKFSTREALTDGDLCQRTPAGIICPNSGTSNVVNSTECSLCREGYSCPEGTSVLKDDMQCPEGFACPPGTKDNDLGDILCPEGFVCERGTLALSKRSASCPEKHYCPAGSGQPTPCPPGTRSDSESTVATKCEIDTTWLIDHGQRVISINPASSRRVRLDPFAYDYLENKWVNPPELTPAEATFELQVRAFDFVHLMFNVTRARDAGLVYDTDWRLALYVDEVAPGRLEKERRYMTAPQPGVPAQPQSVTPLPLFGPGDNKPDSVDRLELALVTGVSRLETQIQQRAVCATVLECRRTAAEEDCGECDTDSEDLREAPPLNTLAYRDGCGWCLGGLELPLEEPADRVPAGSCWGDLWNADACYQTVDVWNEPVRIRRLHVPGLPHLPDDAYPAFQLRDGVDVRYRTALYADSLSLCRDFCEGYKQELWQPPDGAEKRVTVGYDFGFPEGVRYPLPRSMRQVIDERLQLTPTAVDNVEELGFFKLSALVRQDSVIRVEVELLNGNHYSDVMNLFADSMTWSAESPKRTWAQGSEPYPDSAPGPLRQSSVFMRRPSSFLAVLQVTGVHAPALNLHNFFDHDARRLVTGSALYDADALEAPVGFGEHKVLFGFQPYATPPTVDPDAAGLLADPGAVSRLPADEQLLADVKRTSFVSPYYAVQRDDGSQQAPVPRYYPRGHLAGTLRTGSPLPGQEIDKDPVGKKAHPDDDITWESQDLWKDKRVLSLPFLPFFSSCAGFDSYIPIFKLMEDERCEFFRSNVSTPAYPWAVADALDVDSCRALNYSCQYEEDMTESTEDAWWFEQATNDFVFYFTRRPVPLDVFQPAFVGSTAQLAATERTSLSRTANLLEESTGERMWAQHNGVPVVPVRATVTFDRVGALVITPSTAPAIDKGFPRNVHLVLEYWQQNQTYKQLAQANIYFDNFVDPGEADKSYTFEFSWLPLAYWGLVDSFTLPSYVYSALTVITGFGLLAGVMMLWWRLSRYSIVIPRPKLSIANYRRTVVQPAIKGFTYSMVPIMTILVLAFQMLDDDALGSYLLDNVRGNVNDFKFLSLSRKTIYRTGRYGLVFTVIGLYVLRAGAAAIVPDRQKKGAARSSYRPIAWLRNRVILNMLWFCSVFVGLVIFSRTEFYKKNIIIMNPAVKGFAVAVGILVRLQLPDKLVQSPFQMCQQTVIKTMSLGTVGFVAFTVNYVMTVVSGMAGRVGATFAKRLLQRNKPRIERVVGAAKRMAASFSKKAEEEIEEEEFKPEPDHVEKRLEHVREAIIDMFKNSNTTVSQMFTFPFTLFVWSYSEQLQIETKFGGYDLTVFIGFGLVMVIFQFFVDAFLQNLLELAYGWKLNEYIRDSKRRFARRRNAWVLRDTLEDLDPENAKSLDVGMRKIHLMCFSEQFFFITSLVTGGFLLVVYGLYILYVSMRKDPQYWPLTDFPTGLVVIAATIALCSMVRTLVSKAGAYLRVWELPASAKEAAKAAAQREVTIPRYMHLWLALGGDDARASFQAAVAERWERLAHSPRDLALALRQYLFTTIPPLRDGSFGESQLGVVPDAAENYLSEVQRSSAAAIAAAAKKLPDDGSTRDLLMERSPSRRVIASEESDGLLSAEGSASATDGSDWLSDMAAWPKELMWQPMLRSSDGDDADEAKEEE
eukprot:PLAT3280.30.p1 GENE.PLAT3280.30~~PLAT3280.30.p1  ORF type:complete len:2152 (+),score=1031.51 PLAT3280.30:343-6456(+)